MHQLANKTVIVTGAARGLGRCIALGAARAGARVIAVAAHASRELAELRSASVPGTILIVAADITEEPACQRLVDRALAEFGRIDALVNNAAVGMNIVQGSNPCTLPKFWEVSPELWRKMLVTNVIGPFQLTRLVVPHMLAQRSGRIVNLTTSLRTMVRAGYAPYGPSKAALEAATAIWAKELEGTGVTVNALLPGGAANTRMITEREGLPTEALLPPEMIVPPGLWIIGRSPDDFTGMRLVARNWSADQPPDEAARACSCPIEAPYRQI
jgi:NAD(P)-dependent dehydrogenase (short-subunit alcohol dehydrogenase family)